MDIHPLVVHFPIALLTVYSGMELVTRFTKARHWFYVRAVLVITGTAGSFAALATGETAEHAFQNRALHNVIEMHSLFGSVTTWVYGLLAVCYLVLWLDEYSTVLRKLVPIAKKLLGSFVAPLLALLGFLGLSVTGALGATLVYGPDFDFMTSLVYNLLF